MSQISLIVAVDENFGIGKDNALLCHLPADLQHFKSITMGKPIIMGSKTYFSIGKPLPGRENIVLSRNIKFIAGVTVVASLEAALQQVKDYPEIMIIGGAQLFQEALPLAQCIYLTLIHHQFLADTFFPKLEENIWHVQKVSFLPKDTKNLYDLTFYKYTRTLSI